MQARWRRFSSEFIRARIDAYTLHPFTDQVHGKSEPDSQNKALTATRERNARSSVSTAMGARKQPQPPGRAKDTPYLLSALRTFSPWLPLPAEGGASCSRGGGSGREDAASRPQGWAGPGSSGGGGAGTVGLAMAANLSRNGPALQDAYVRVVTEKSPTDWWESGGSEPGRGREARGRGCAGAPSSPTPAPRSVRCRPYSRHPPSRQSRGAWGSHGAPLPPRRPPCWLPRQAAADDRPHTKGISAAVGGSISPSAHCRDGPWASGARLRIGALPGSQGFGSPGLCECGFQTLPFSENNPSRA